MSGVKGIIGMHRFNFCLVVVLSLSCSGVNTITVRPIYIYTVVDPGGPGGTTTSPKFVKIIPDKLS